MYESFYGFSETPFRLSADEKFCYAHSHYERVFECVTSSLEEAKGFILLTGLSGSGKSILCRDVISKLDKDRFVPINLMLSQLSAEELLRKIALELGIAAEQFNRLTLLSSIHDCMKDLYRMGKRLIVFLDETENILASEFAELRLLSTLQDVENSVLQVVLIANPELREPVLDACMECIPQKTIISCELDCMTAEQTEGYIQHRLMHVGWKRDPEIDDGVYSIIYDVTQGIARSVNHVMSHLLLFTAFESKHQINVEDTLSAMEMLIKDDRLTLNSGETLDAIKERYKSSELTKNASISKRESCGAMSVESGSCRMDGSLFDHKSLPDSLSSQLDLITNDNDVGQGYEEVDYSIDDWDFSDTELLDWDNQDKSIGSGEAMSQSTHTSSVVLPAGSREKERNEGLESKPSKDEHNWGGVWWMSDDVRGKALPRSIVVDELPSITIEECPELISENAPVWATGRRRMTDVHGLKRTILYALVVGSGILLIILLLSLIM